jgi:hypothetical protein
MSECSICDANERAESLKDALEHWGISEWQVCGPQNRVMDILGEALEQAHLVLGLSPALPPEKVAAYKSDKGKLAALQAERDALRAALGSLFTLNEMEMVLFHEKVCRAEYCLTCDVIKSARKALGKEVEGEQ